MDSLALFAVCPKGVEDALVGEVRRMGFEGVEPRGGGVAFRGGTADLYRANLWLRTANRILVNLHPFPCQGPKSADRLYEAAAAVEWERWGGADGTISVVTASAPNTVTTVGNLQLARFPNPAGLHSEGRNLLAETAASGTPNVTTPGQNGAGMLQQGFLERSNVEVVTELVNLILPQRAYEINSRAIRASDEMLAIGNNLTR